MGKRILIRLLTQCLVKASRTRLCRYCNQMIEADKQNSMGIGKCTFRIKTRQKLSTICKLWTVLTAPIKVHLWYNLMKTPTTQIKWMASSIFKCSSSHQKIPGLRSNRISKRHNWIIVRFWPIKSKLNAQLHRGRNRATTSTRHLDHTILWQRRAKFSILIWCPVLLRWARESMIYPPTADSAANSPKDNIQLAPMPHKIRLSPSTPWESFACPRTRTSATKTTSSERSMNSIISRRAEYDWIFRNDVWRMVVKANECTNC